MSGARGQDVVSEETNVTAQRDELSRVISSMSCREGAPRNLVYLPWTWGTWKRRKRS